MKLKELKNEIRSYMIDRQVVMLDMTDNVKAYMKFLFELDDTTDKQLRILKKLIDNTII